LEPDEPTAAPRDETIGEDQPAALRVARRKNKQALGSIKVERCVDEPGRADCTAA
jgi:hypothetical protein